MSQVWWYCEDQWCHTIQTTWEAVSGHTPASEAGTQESVLFSSAQGIITTYSKSENQGLLYTTELILFLETGKWAWFLHGGSDWATR